MKTALRVRSVPVRWSRRHLAVALAGAWLVLVSTAGAGWAHSDLTGSTPSAGQVLTQPPALLRLSFSDPVDPQLCHVVVRSTAGTTVPLGPLRASPGEAHALEVVPDAELSSGSYTVEWRRVGDDGHATTGSFSFEVRAAPVAGQVGPAVLPTPVAPKPLINASVPDSFATSLLFGTARWVGFIGFALLVGSAFFLVRCRPGQRHVSACRRLTVTGAVLVGAASLVGLLLYGPYAVGAPPSRVLDGALLAAASTSTVGLALLARLGVLAALVVVALVLSRRPALLHRLPPSAVLTAAVCLAATWSMAGHSRSSAHPLIMVPVDVVHLVAAGVWVGGLVALAATALRGQSEGWDLVKRFSPTALTCVLVLAATGFLQASERLGSWSRFTDTDYGRLLLGKLLLVAFTITLAATARTWLTRTVTTRSAPGRGQPGGAFRGVVLTEAAFGFLVLAATSVIVSTAPAQAADHRDEAPAAPAAAVSPAAVRPEVPVTATLPYEGGAFQLSVIARVGATDVHVSVLNSHERMREVSQLAGALRLAGGAGTPLPVRFVQLGPGHYLSVGATFPVAGTWQLGLAATLPSGTRATAVAGIRVR